MKGYCIYLRKSRADAEAEARGEGETLMRHQNMLTELAEKQKLNIVKIYKEIVSGDSIAARPQMQALLADVNEGKYIGVLVVEIERLARGDTIDQGIVAQAFRSSSTKIITPSKTYDPDNEFDEEYFEFSLFMSRREYKTIKRRMQAGRLSSVKEGNYIGSVAPYGYRKADKGAKVHTLEIVSGEAEAVRLIYKLYLEGYGAGHIASQLDSMGISPRKSMFWEQASIKKILSNPLYCGKLSWKTRANGDKLYKGVHEPIISEEIFNAVQDKKKAAPAVQLHANDRLRNYYHSILYCQNCGHQLKRRYISESGNEHMLCTYKDCRGNVVSSNMEVIDEAVLSAIRYRTGKLGRMKCSGISKSESHVDKKALLMAELEKNKRQLSRMYDLLEQEVYDMDIFLERSKNVNERIKLLEKAAAESESDAEPSPKKCINSLEKVVDNFSAAAPEEKNRMLRAVVRRINYHKTKRMCKNKQISDLALDVEFL